MTHGYGRRICALGIVLIGLLASCITGQEGKTEVNKWENDIKTFEAWDAKNSFPKDAVLFAGSSSIRMWDTAKLFAEYPVINRGFGGSQISDMNLYVERIVLPYKPKVIVFYCGVNDIVGGGKAPEQVVADFKQFLATVHAALPETPVIFLSIRLGPAWWPHHPRTDRVNASVRELADKLDYLHYADVTTGMMGADGTPEPSLFLDDKIHLTSEGNAKWADLLRPTLKKVYDETNSKH
jgi:lysophospholipase L1-like esterase